MTNLKPYSKYKKTNIEWIGEIPKRWEIKKLKYSVSLLSEKGNGEKKIALENIKSKVGNFVSTNTIFQGDGIEFKIGDILFGKLRPYLAKVWVAEFGGDAVGDFFVMRANEDNYSTYRKYQILSEQVIDILDGSTYGAKMPRVSWDFMGSIELPEPSLQEQTTIATYLDRKSSLIDKLITNNEKQIKLLEEKRKAIINQAVTCGIDENGNLRKRLNKDAKSASGWKDSGVEWIGEILEGGQVVKVGNIANVGSSKRVFEESYQEEGIPFYRSKEIVELSKGLETSARIYISESLHKEIAGKYLMPEKEDLLVTSIGTIGLTWLCDGRDFYYKDGNITQIHGLGKVSMRFLQFCFDSYLFEVQYDYMSAGSTLMALTIEKIKTLQMSLPNLEEQEKIVSFLDEKLDRLNTLIKTIKKQNTLLKEYRQSLISHVVTGKIDVRNVKFDSKLIRYHIV